MENVLVLGGTQFFGKQLVNKLLEKGKNVTIATRGLAQDPFGDKVTRLVIDREHKESMLKAFEDKKWDVVYDQSCFSPCEALDCVEVLRGKVNRYIFTSTQAVYEFGVNHKEDVFEPQTFKFKFKNRREYIGLKGYQEAKRSSETVLFNQNFFDTVAVRFPIVIGKDDYTNRLKFYVDKVVNQESIVVENPNIRMSFILSDEAADFLYFIGESNYMGSINPGSKGDISLLELVQKIEKLTGINAILTNKTTNNKLSPYSLPGSLSINTEKVERLGFKFSNLNQSIDALIEHYYLENISKTVIY